MDILDLLEIAPDDQDFAFVNFPIRSIFQKTPSYFFFTLSATPPSYFLGPENTCRIKNYSDITNSLKNINKLIETDSKKVASLNQFMTASNTQRKTIILVKRLS